MLSSRGSGSPLATRKASLRAAACQLCMLHINTRCAVVAGTHTHLQEKLPTNASRGHRRASGYTADKEMSMLKKRACTCMRARPQQLTQAAACAHAKKSQDKHQRTPCQGTEHHGELCRVGSSTHHIGLAAPQHTIQSTFMMVIGYHMAHRESYPHYSPAI